jgi:hypothetical protein
MAYLGKTPSQAVRSRYYFTATGGETSLSGADDNANTLTFTDGNYVDVALNGVTLVAGTDYNTTTANTIAGLTALVASDVVEVIVYDTFSVFGGNMAANLNFKDNVKANFGTGSDLQIYHDGSNSFVSENGIGSLFLQGDVVAIRNSSGTEDFAQFTENGAATLYHNNAIKFATTATGVDVTGTVTASGDVIRNDTTTGTSKFALQYSGADAAVFKRNNSTGVATIANGYAGAPIDAINISLAGNVGIGTTSPDTNLDVERSSNDTGGIKVQNTNNTQGSAVAQVEISGGDNAYANLLLECNATNHSIRQDGSGNLKITNGSTERLRIDSSGNLLVGTTNANPAENNVAGIGLLAGNTISVTDDGGAPIQLNRKTSDGSIAIFRKDGTTVGSIGSASSGGVFDISGAANDVRITGGNASYWLGTNAVYAGNNASRDLGTSSYAWKDLYLSGGVYLGGTAAANHLDYYEEGTSTIGISAASGSGGTISGGSMTWTRIGNQVIVAGNFTVSSLGTLSGSFYITGFPFTASATFLQSQGSVRSQGIGGADNLPVVIEMEAGTSNARMHFFSGTSTQLTVQASAISASDFIAFGLTYQI